MLLTKDQANADIAIKNKLFVEGWGLFAFLEKTRNARSKSIVRIHYEKFYSLSNGQIQYCDIPVAVLLITPQPCAPKQAMIFVKEEYRLKGIASKMLSRFKAENPFAQTGIQGSKEFWEKQGINVV